MEQCKNNMKNKLSVKIVVATHKQYRMPEDDMYIPLHVGAEGKAFELGYIKDNIGDNISERNTSFCELTGLYWAWKNLDTDYLGLVHYRRHFSIQKRKDRWSNILTYEQLKPYLENVKVFVPKKRKYYIETLYSHYKHTHYANHLDIIRSIIRKEYPQYANSYDQVIRRTCGYMFNMMIMDRIYLDDYCTWLFNILFELEKEIGDPGLSAYQGRYLGRVSEILFNVWLDKKLFFGEIRKDQIMELSYIHMEKVNWRRKGMAFIRAKFLGVKYEGSF